MTNLESTFNNVPKLLALSVTGVLDRQITPLGHNLLGGKGSLRESPTRVRPRSLQGFDILLVYLVFMV